jgi:hypothetical protein
MDGGLRRVHTLFYIYFLRFIDHTKSAISGWRCTTPLDRRRAHHPRRLDMGLPDSLCHGFYSKWGQLWYCVPVVSAAALEVTCFDDSPGARIARYLREIVPIGNKVTWNQILYLFILELQSRASRALNPCRDDCGGV